jgi:hypothetical protein
MRLILKKCNQPAQGIKQPHQKIQIAINSRAYCPGVAGSEVIFMLKI